MIDPQLPPMLTEEEAERKAAMIKAANEVADAVDEMKKSLESKGWRTAEQAALTLFNTMMMTAFGEQMKNSGKEKEQEKKLEDAKTRMINYAIELANRNGFRGDDVTHTCVEMLLDDKPEQQAAAVWEDFYGEGTKEVLFSIVRQAKRKIADELAGKENNK